MIGLTLRVLAWLRLHGIVLPALARIGRSTRAWRTAGAAHPAQRAGAAGRSGSPGRADEAHAAMRDAGAELVDADPLKYLVRGCAAGSAHEPPPLLCFLHGFDEAAPLDIFRALTRHGPLAPAAHPFTERFVLVAPQLPAAGDLWHGYAEAVRRIVLEEARRRGCDVRRLYLTGFSFGGNGVLDLALGRSDLWAALWPVDPTRVPPRPIATPIWLSLGEVSRYQARGFVRRLALQPADAASGADHVWEDRGADHAGTASLAYRDGAIYRWLLGKRLQ